METKLIPQFVESANLNCLAYHAGDLYVRFKSGTSYKYPNVPPEIYSGILTADSVGHFFHLNVKGRFRYEKLPGDPFTEAQPPVGPASTGT